MFEKRFAGLPRHALEALAAALQDEHERKLSELAQTYSNLTATQALCTAQLEELRHYRRSGLCLPGWHCRGCGGFNGSAKGVRETCRACGLPKS